MKISKIENEGCIYTVTFKPNWLESLFGFKEKTEKFKDTHSTYTFGSGHVYVDRNGNTLGNHFGYKSSVREAIDKWRRKW